MLSARAPRRAAARGLSIVELMVGVAIGLIVVAASVHLSGRNIASSRSMLTDIRVVQDLCLMVEHARLHGRAHP